jgi:hypothetical protein
MKLSRHIKNNMRLYNITEEDILKVLELPDSTGSEGGKLTAIRKYSKKFRGLPLKVVYEKTEKDMVIITVYPLKKKSWR